MLVFLVCVTVVSKESHDILTDFEQILGSALHLVTQLGSVVLTLENLCSIICFYELECVLSSDYIRIAMVHLFTHSNASIKRQQLFHNFSVVLTQNV